jgi:DNA invertase Pin-like site-specific DNA recombinase
VVEFSDPQTGDDNVKKYIPYYRVSTKKQKRSGLGLEAQKADANRLVEFNEGKIIAEYTEVETGKKSDRPELQKAIDHARLSKATLVIARLDRLARNVAFTSALMDSGVDFVCCDMPSANRLTIHILAAVAEEEARKVSERTRNALAAAAARGVKLGSNRPGHWDGREHKRGWKKAIKVAAQKRQEKTANTYAFLMPKIKEMRDRGDTLPEIVEWLNAQGHTTTAGKPFTQTAVWRLIDRYLGKKYLGNNLRKMARA